MEYSECLDCGFVLKPENTTDPRPKHWSSCPGCEGEEFRFVDAGPSVLSSGSR
jgi:predicted Zn-ribbon and HTH transcriptional regulator